MKQIGKTVYDNLSIEERTRAAVAAGSRGDDAELGKLSDTCPSSARRGFADRMRRIWGLAFAMECDLRGMAIRFLQYAYREKGLGDDDHDTLEEIIAATDGILRDIRSIDEAFMRVVAQLGIEADEIGGMLRDPVTENLVKHARAHYSPDSDFLAKAQRLMEDKLRMRA